MRRVAIMAVLVCACMSTPAPTPEVYTIEGTFRLTDTSELWFSDRPCAGDGGYSDVQGGTQVTVRDEANLLLATSSLGPGTTEEIYRCAFAFALDDVPRASFYTIEVGRRGDLSYSYEEMVAREWTVDFSLGD